MQQQKNRQSQSSLVTFLSQVFVLYFIYVPISSILFNSFLQLLTDRNPQTFQALAFVCFRFFFLYIFLAIRVLN